MKLKILVGLFSFSCMGHMVQAQTRQLLQCPEYRVVMGNPHSENEGGGFYFKVPSSWTFEDCQNCVNDLNGDQGRNIGHINTNTPLPNVIQIRQNCVSPGRCYTLCGYAAYKSENDIGKSTDFEYFFIKGLQ